MLTILHKPILNICFCFDNNLIHFLSTVIVSVLRKNHQYAICFHLIVDDSIDMKYCKKLFTKQLFPNLQFKFYNKNWCLIYNGLKHITKTTMIRLFIPELLFNCSKVIYLDVDVIVNCDLYKALHAVQINNIGIAMKDSININHLKKQTEKQSANCGVLFLDCDILRQNHFTNKCIELCEQHPNLHDQEIINVYCGGNHTKLEANYNIFYNQDSNLLDKFKDNFIFHFAGSNKPYYNNIPDYQYLWDRNGTQKDTKINFGVLHYTHDEIKMASTNIGDYIQSLATLNYYKKYIETHLDVTFENFESFLDLALRNEIKHVNFVFITRDNIGKLQNYYGYDKILLVMNGWWLHPTNKQILFEIPDNIIPLFISFHISNQGLLNETFIHFFKKYEPIGCRDQNTMKLLNSKNIKTYFSGCLTIGIDFFNWNDILADKVDTLFVDVKNNNRKIKHISHESVSYKNMHYTNALKIAFELLKTYSKAKHVTTSRLHCYMPCFAMNIPVTLISPSNKKKKDWGPPNRMTGLVDIVNKDNKAFYISFQKSTIFKFIKSNTHTV